MITINLCPPEHDLHNGEKEIEGDATKKRKHLRLIAFIFLATLILFLGTVACNRERTPQPKTTLTAHLSQNKGSMDVLTMTPVQPAVTSVLPMATATTLSPLSGSDGGVIVFQTDRDRQDEIYIMNADGSTNPQQLTYNAEIDQDRSPTWPPVHTDLPKDEAQKPFDSIQRSVPRD